MSRFYYTDADACSIFRRDENRGRLRLIEKERFKSKVYTTVLNPEQCARADELQKTWHSRLDRLAERIKP
jgi:hypothetical protein